MTDSGQIPSTADFKPFEGLWLLTKPSGTEVCAKVVKGKLLIPASFGGDGKLTGHFYDCRVAEKTLICRFEQFDSAISGVLFLNVGPNETLTSGRWMSHQIPQAVQRDILVLSDSLPGMQPVVWVRILNSDTPPWAEKYFSEDWPNKASS